MNRLRTCRRDSCVSRIASSVGLRTRRICRWRDGKMLLRWAAAAYLITEKSFRKIQDYRGL